MVDDSYPSERTETPNEAFASAGNTETKQRSLMDSQENHLDQDALRRINTWLDRLEDQAKRLLESFLPEELEPMQAANMAGKYITLIARLLELRQQFTTETSSAEERLLQIIFGDSSRLGPKEPRSSCSSETDG